MKTKPQPLEFDEIIKEFFIKYKGFDEKSWQEFWKDYKKSDIIKDIKLIIDLYKQRLKSACEFYLKYKDKPELFDKEQYKNYVRQIFWSSIDNYNDWLFKLAFKDVLEGK